MEPGLEHDVNEILEKIHTPSGEYPRLEIEGCHYPRDERLLASYHQCTLPLPKREGRFSVLNLSEVSQDKDSWKQWMKQDGFGGQVGSVDVKSEYLKFLNAPEGDKCAYVIRNVFDRPDNYTTEIDGLYVLFRKSHLAELIERALKSDDKKITGTIQGKCVSHQELWEDVCPSGPGKKADTISVTLEIDLSEKSPKYTIKATL